MIEMGVLDRRVIWNLRKMEDGKVASRIENFIWTTQLVTCNSTTRPQSTTTTTAAVS
jgi:hypothetical protein